MIIYVDVFSEKNAMILDSFNFSKNPFPDFHNHKLLSFRKVADDHFWLPPVERVIGDVDLRAVIGLNRAGTGYDDEVSWGELAMGCPRLKSNLKMLDYNPLFYLEQQQVTDWCFTECEGHVFIGPSGRHRSIILRCLAHANPDIFPQGPIAKSVHILKAKVDRPARELDEAARALIGQMAGISLTARYIVSPLLAGETLPWEWTLTNTNSNKALVVRSLELQLIVDRLNRLKFPLDAIRAMMRSVWIKLRIQRYGHAIERQ